MEVLYPRCCGLDVHKSSITACVLLQQPSKPLRHIRRFGCTTGDLHQLVAWLRELGVEHVAMESTGVYWKPVWNILEDHFQIVLANAHHIKAVPGRKTDTKDCQWIAEILQHGLLRASHIPPVVIRDLRDLTRARTSLSQEHSWIASRIQKVREDANIKLASVASKTLGKSGRTILQAIISGEESSERLADLALGHLRAKIPQLQAALAGRVREHHRFLLQSLLRQLHFLEAEIAALDARLDQLGQEHMELADALNRWITVPGVDRVDVKAAIPKTCTRGLA
jgi:transposase